MESDKEKENYSCDSLDCIEPIARIGISQIVRPRLHRNYQTVDGMVDERYKDSAYFYEQDVRNRLQVFDSVIEVLRARQ